MLFRSNDTATTEIYTRPYTLSLHDALPILESVSADVRAMLALFCYKRSHLHSLALAIAASCNERDLIQLGGRVGSTLYALSREAPVARATPSSYGNRKPITLSTKPLSSFAPLDDELDDEDFAQAVTA